MSVFSLLASLGATVRKKEMGSVSQAKVIFAIAAWIGLNLEMNIGWLCLEVQEKNH